MSVVWLAAFAAVLIALLAVPVDVGFEMHRRERTEARVRVRALECTARLGLDDPADTGRLWGLVGPASALLALPRAVRIRLVPEFGGALFHLDARGEARLVPGAVVLTVLAFVLAPATLRAAWAGARA